MKYLFYNFFYNLFMEALLAILVSLFLNGLGWFFVAVIGQQVYAFRASWKVIYLVVLALVYFYDFVCIPIHLIWAGIKGARLFRTDFMTVLEARVELKKYFVWDWDLTPEEFREELREARTKKFAQDVVNKFFSHR